MEQPNLNTGEPWTPMEALDLRICRDQGDSIAAIAHFLCRTEAEIREQMAAVAREAELDAAEEEKWRAAVPCFVRFGELPAGGRSRNCTTGELEAGVSVFRGERLPTGEARALPRGYGELGSMLAARMAGAPLFIVEGEEIGIGSDGEPVLADCRIAAGEAARG